MKKQKSKLANTLEAKRKELGLKQREVAEAGGVKRPTYSAYENDTIIPGVYTLKRIAGLYGCTVDELL